MIHVDSASDIPSEITNEGIAEKSAELLKASRNCARQKMSRSTYRRAGEYFCGTRPSTRVCAGESTVDFEVGGASMSSFLITPKSRFYDVESERLRMGDGREDDSKSCRGKASSGSCEACGS